MAPALPDIPEPERTPLVLLLLDIIHQQQQRIAQLEDEIALLKGLKPRPKIQPSILETPPAPPTTPPQKRPGPEKPPRLRQPPQDPPPHHPPQSPRPPPRPAPRRRLQGPQATTQDPAQHSRNP